MSDGTLHDIRVVRSLDAAFGLDREAIASVALLSGTLSEKVSAAFPSRALWGVGRWKFLGRGEWEIGS